MPNDVSYPGIMVKPSLLIPAHVGDGVAAIMPYAAQHYLGHVDLLARNKRRLARLEGDLALHPDDLELKAQVERQRLEVLFQQSRVAYWAPRYTTMLAAVGAWDNDEPIPPYTGPG